MRASKLLNTKTFTRVGNHPSSDQPDTAAPARVSPPLTLRLLVTVRTKMVQTNTTTLATSHAPATNTKQLTIAIMSTSELLSNEPIREQL